jgi:hypothetical protein
VIKDVKQENQISLRKIIIIFAAILILVMGFSVEASAQKRKVQNLPSYDEAPYHFGFILGLNQMSFSVKPVKDLPFIKWDPIQSPDIFADSLFVYSITSSSTPGFTIGILANVRLGKYFDFRFVPSLSFGERILNYDIRAFKDGESQRIETTKSITSTFIDFPIEFKYKSKRLNNMRAYVLAGASFTLDLASQKKAAQSSSDVTVKINKNDILLSAGVGLDFYTSYFKFGMQAKMSYGLNNLIQYEDNIYTNSIESLRSKVFLLSFTFE